ncbi:MAG TPA: hypothetical protein DEA50_04960 [Parvularcula sp.]|nr:hypothetical protein [Parvularcula sp.]
MHPTKRFRALLLMLAVSLAAPAAADEAPGAWAKEWRRTDFSRMTVDAREIESNVARDSIRSIDRPRFVAVQDVEIEGGDSIRGPGRYSRRVRSGDIALSRRDPVISFVEKDVARAYPLRIMMFHEIVNDTVAGRPVAVTFCPLCNAAVVFDRRIDGQPVEFGTTGKLRHSDLVMYDRTTHSWWQQFTGAGIVGVHAGRRLQRLAARLESFENFAQRFPEGEVLMPDEFSTAPYGRNPYLRYDSASRPFLYRGGLPDGIKPLERVVVVEGAAYALSLVQKNGVIEENGYRVRWSLGQASALDTASIAEGREVGNVIVEKRSKSGDWAEAPADVVFAFAFHAFHPEAEWRK